MKAKRQRAIWLILILITTLCTPFAAFAEEAEFDLPKQNGTPAVSSPTDTEPPEPDNAYTVILEAQTVASDTNLCYETVSPQFAGMVSPPDYYPGELAVEITGQIVIESGGSLTIGTMSIGSEDEASPVIRGALQADGLIVVKSGGSLTLKDTSFDFTGEGLLIVQEPGASVSIQGMTLDDALAYWAPPMVDNAFHQPEDQWLEEGTVLTEELLPQTLTTNLQYQGISQYTEIALQWNLAEYSGQSSGKLVLTGRFADEQGAEISSCRPLTLTVHWYAPEQLVVTYAVFMGDSSSSAKLQLQELPKKATQIGGKVWGEVSADNKTWTSWEDFEVRQSDEMVACVFYLPDNTPRYFRVRASNDRRNLYWRSDSFLLPSDDSDDSGGNHGGSISPVTPTREPEPVPTPSPVPTAEPTPVPTMSPSPVPSSTAVPSSPSQDQPSPSQTQGVVAVPTNKPIEKTTDGTAAMPEDNSAPPSAQSEHTGTDSTPQPVRESSESSVSTVPSDHTASVPSSSALPAATEQPAKSSASEGLSPFAQVLLVIAGLGVCAAVGVIPAKILGEQKKRK